MNRLLFKPTLALGVSLAALSSGCKDPEYRVDARAGEYQVSVRADGDRDMGAIARTEYKARGKRKTVEQEVSFSRVLGVPVLARTVKERTLFDLSELQILETQTERPLFTLSAAMRRLWDPLVRKGVRIDLSVSRPRPEQPPQVVTRIGVSPTPPPLADSIFEYVPVTDRFPNPLELIESPDPAAVLAELRKIASATVEYHHDLAKVVDLTPGLRTVDLVMLMDAAYFTEASLREHVSALERLEKGPRTPEVRDLVAQVSANISKIKELAPHVNGLAAAAMAKLTDVSFSAGLDAINRLFEARTGGHVETDSAFRTFVARLASLQAGEKLVLMNLAITKGAITPAVELGMRWFREDANRSIDTLVGVLATFPPSPRAQFAIAAIDSLGAGTLSPSALLSIAGTISNDRKAEVLLSGAAKIARLATAESVSLLLLLDVSTRTQLAEALFGKLSDLSPSNAALFLEVLRPDVTATIGTRYVSTLNPLLSADLATVATVLDGERRDTLILAELPRVADPAVPAAGSLLKLLSSATREETTLRHVDALRSLTTDALIAFSEAALSRGTFVLTAYLDRVTDFTVPNATRIAERLDGADRETVLVLGLERAASMTADELVAASGTSRNQATALVFRYLGKVRDLDASSAARIAARLQGPAKDRLVREAISRIASLTTAGALELSAAAHADGETLIVASLPKISDLTVDNAVVLVGKLSLGNRDSFLLAAVMKVTNLTPENLMTLASHAHQLRDEVIRKGMERLSRP